jgi:hypothetical protein
MWCVELQVQECRVCRRLSLARLELKAGHDESLSPGRRTCNSNRGKHVLLMQVLAPRACINLQCLGPDCSLDATGAYMYKHRLGYGWPAIGLSAQP